MQRREGVAAVAVIVGRFRADRELEGSAALRLLGFGADCRAGDREGKRTQESEDRHLHGLLSSLFVNAQIASAPLCLILCFMAGDDVSRSNLSHPWDVAPTLLACDRTAGMEHAARGRGQGRRNFTL